jgi:hypothetical protein
LEALSRIWPEITKLPALSHPSLRILAVAEPIALKPGAFCGRKRKILLERKTRFATLVIHSGTEL